MEDFGILFVDDEKEILNIVDEYLTLNGYTVTVADNGLKALEHIKETGYDIVFTDLNMPGFSGLELLAAIKEVRPETEVVIVTGFGTIESAIEALKLGSYDYLQKPIKLERLKLLIDRIIEKKKLQRENILIKRRLKERYRYDELVGVSPKMQEIYEKIDRMISINAPTVLIQGESGTGKEVVARVIHRNSYYKDKPFVPVNCGAMVEGLLESELFGHVKGSFTGAIRDKMGLFKAAEGGTLFLDEIAELSPNLQVKLLRILQEQEFERVGGTKTIKCDIRVIAATNRDLDKLVKDGQFREDLYYRLKVIPVVIPPLRERRSDIPLLVHHFMENISKSRKKKIKGMSKDIVKAFMEYDWPGNVRELENIIERMIILSEGDELTIQDLPDKIIEKHHHEEDAVDPVIPEEGFSLNNAINEYERLLIVRALEKADWVKNRAAKILNMNRTTLVEKIKKQGIERPRRAMN